MKKLIAAMALASAVLAIPNTTKAEVINLNEKHGVSAEWYGTLTYDSDTKTMLMEDTGLTRDIWSVPTTCEMYDYETLVLKGDARSHTAMFGNDNTKSIDISDVDFSNCTEISIWDFPDLKSVKTAPDVDFSTITEINIGNVNSSTVPFLFLPGVEYNFCLGGKGSFKWYYRPEDKEALLAAEGISDRVDHIENNHYVFKREPLVSNENPLYDAVELTEDMFEFPESIKKSEVLSSDFDINTIVHLKSEYICNYRLCDDARIRERYPDDDYTFGEEIQVTICSDGGITSYVRCRGTVTIDVIHDIVPEEVPPFDDFDDDEEEALEIGDSFTVGNNQYQVTDDDEVEFFSTKNTKTLSIPATVAFDGIMYKVTSIVDCACSGNKKLTKVTIGKNVQVIERYAFEDCTNLKSVTIGTGVTEIGERAFAGCKNLKTVTVKSTKLKTIEKQVFQGCAKLTSITLPKSVKTIKSKAFYGCKNLKTVTIKSTKVKTISKQAFKGCNKKLTVKVPKAKYSKYKSLLKKAGVKTIKKF